MSENESVEKRDDADGPERGKTGDVAKNEAAERRLEEGKERLEKTLEGDLNETLGE
jgi:hypothetical protein